MEHIVYDGSWGVFPPDTEPLPLAAADIGPSRDVYAADGYLYTIGTSGGGSFGVFDISGEHADSPLPLGVLRGLGNTRQLEVSGSIAAVTAREFGLYLIDVSDKSKPELLCHYDTVELATGVALYADYAFVGCRQFGVEAIDISDPASPRHVGNIRAGEVQSVFVSDGILYTGSWGEMQVNIIDVRDPASPKPLSVINLSGRGDGVYVKDGVLYAAVGHHKPGNKTANHTNPCYGYGNGMEIYDVSDPREPVLLSRTMLSHRFYYHNCDMWDVVRSGRFAVLSHTYNGVYVYDVSSLTSPALVAHAAIPTDKKLKITPSVLASHPPVLSFDPDKTSYSPVSGVAVTDGRLYIACMYETMRIASSDILFHESDILSPAPLKKSVAAAGTADDSSVIIRPVEGQVNALAYLDGRIYAASGMGGIGVFDARTLEPVGHLRTRNTVTDIHEKNRRLYAACGTAGIAVFEPDGDTFRQVGAYKSAGHTFMQLVPSENCRHAMAHTDDKRLVILNISDPSDIYEELCDEAPVGLIYHRQLTYTGVGGRYYGCFWNGTEVRWYDLGGETPVRAGGTRYKLSLRDGITGFDDDGTHALAVTANGCTILDIRENAVCGALPLPGTAGVRGKPVTDGRLLVIGDRISGIVTVFDITGRTAPVLLRKIVFSGFPDLACIAGRDIFIPLGHDGIAKVTV